MASSSPAPISHFPSPFTERDLARLWRDQTFPAEALITNQGERLRVIYRGRPGAGAGPDFRDALLATPGGLLLGDVELHVRSSDFHRHGHNADPAYANVVLHLVFHDDDGGRTALPGGHSAAAVSLGDWARGRAAEIERWLARPALWREPCFSALRRLGAAEVGATLDRLGNMRFRQKAAAIAKEVGGEDAEQVLWEALLGALAFGSAREHFGLLAQRLPWTQLRIQLAALPARERRGEAMRMLAGAAETIGGFGRGGGRPAGRPQKRLQGAAALAARFAGTGLARSLIERSEGAENQQEEAESGERKHERPKTKRNTNDAGASLGSSSLEFRSRSGRRRSQPLSSLIESLTVPGLVGRSRAVEIVGNAVLPWLAALGPESRTRAAEALSRQLPLPARYGSVRHLHEAVGSRACDKPTTDNREQQTFETQERGQAGVRVDFRRQQGMLYLLRHYCTQGGCGRCPLS